MSGTSSIGIPAGIVQALFRIPGYGTVRIRPTSLVEAGRWIAAGCDPDAGIVQCVRTVDGLGELEPELMTIAEVSELLCEVRPRDLTPDEFEALIRAARHD